MKRIISYMAFALVLATAIIGCENEPTQVSGTSEDLMSNVQEENIDTQDMVTTENNTKITDLSVELLKNTFDKEGENSMISPISIIYALGMTTNGASGETLEELENTLGMPIDDLNGYLHGYFNSLETSEDYKFNLANSIWINENSDFRANEEFLKVNKNYYDAQIYSSPFTEETVEEVNNWVNENTQEMIPTVLDEIPEGSIMFLINALSLDAKWENPYVDTAISEGEFTKEDGEAKTVEFMYEDLYEYIEGESETGFKKDYVDGKYSFVALLPNEDIPMNDYLENLNGEKIQNLLENISEEEVQTLLPKFETTYDLSLVEPLQAMGVHKGFSPSEADFSNMGTTNDNIFISNIIHKTFINVDEAGTQAGAVTSTIMNTTSMPVEPPKQVYLDRPFVYMIVDNENNIPLFIGNLMDPESE